MVKPRRPNFKVEDLAKKLTEFESGRVGKARHKKVSGRELAAIWGMCANSTTTWRAKVNGKTLKIFDFKCIFIIKIIS